MAEGHPVGQRPALGAKLDAILQPRSIAIVGASQDADEGRRAPGRTAAPLWLPRRYLPGEPARRGGAGPAGLPVR